MATGDIFVNPQELESIAGQVEEQVSRYKSCYDRILGVAEDLATTWKGDASLAFATQVRGFQSDFESMQKLLAKYAEFLRVAGNNYQRTENINIENARIDLTFN